MRKIYFLLCVSILFVNCKKDKNNSISEFDNGLIILNEGVFGTGTGTVTYWDRSTKANTTDVFANVNGGALLGNIAQSMTVNGDRRFIVVNNSNKVVVTDINFKFVSEISGLESPRYLLLHNNKAYVTQWGTDGFSGSLAIIDLEKSTIIKKINLGAGPENMLVKGDVLYIGTTGGYGVDNKIYKVDLTSDLLSSTVTMPFDNPASIVEKSGSLWVLCKGYYNFGEPANSTDGAILQVNDNLEVLNSVTFLGQADNFMLPPNGSNAYLTIYGYTFTYDFGNTIASVPIDRYLYKLGWDIKGNRLVGLDARDFSTSGVALFYENNVAVDSFVTGIIPTAVY